MYIKILVASLALMLGACDGPQVLVCTQGGKETFRSEPTYGIRIADFQGGVYQLGRYSDGSIYRTRPGEYCTIIYAPRTP